MKQLTMILLVALAACSNPQADKQQDNKDSNKHEHSAASVSTNNGAKWKADEATKKNVAAMIKVVNDTTYASSAKRNQLSANLQSAIDTLVKECRMKGPEHDALHAWLEKVLHDVKEIKEGDDEYKTAYAALKKDVESFYQSFE